MVNRVVFGERNGDYGFWVSKPGFDVLTTGPSNLLASSDNYLDRILAQGAVEHTIDPNETTTTIVTLPDIGGEVPVVKIYQIQGILVGWTPSEDGGWPTPIWDYSSIQTHDLTDSMEWECTDTQLSITSPPRPLPPNTPSHSITLGFIIFAVKA